MTTTRRALFGSAAAAGLIGASKALAADLVPAGFDQVAKGPFEPTWASLDAGYRTPDWFRDAKFGLWAHWGAQCVPEAGDWYARNMYMPGQRAYDHHLRTYGHPADTGFIDIYPQWRAENWNPDALLDLYAKAGAKYFVAMANHHDNFDAYDSKFHDWNSVRIGPKKDIIGLWAKAARKQGLRFGVSNHSAHAWHWFQTAYGYDPEGPRKGERYDAFKRFAADGRGQWWEGLDPQQLYGGSVMPLPDGIETNAAANAWHEANDRVWTEKPPLNNPAFTRQWYLRCKDLIDSYQPDLIYFDNFDLPLGQAGLDIAAHYYNASLRWRGKLEAVINIKPHDTRRPGIVADVERGLRREISPEPWQTCTCIGDWHYNRRLFEQKRYLPAAEVIHRLCDIVSKNGNLLLSIPVRGDGTIDSEERRIVEEIGAWMGRFSDAIHGTRPWTIFGEGPTDVAAGMFSEGKQKPFTPQDIRFTTKGAALYAITLGRPEGGQVVVNTLARGGRHAKRPVRKVTLAGDKTPLPFHQDQAGLRVTLPDSALHPFGVALRIVGVL
ncbi:MULTISPECIES: alpha-L-fucosidase [unclassified Caulobacter]|uniref:alpha-L-fucosidase n=1 Tax=unclassified Caulobacter TaxID=2648921 RepID=UPI0006FE2ED9|nr:MULTISPECIES: alpha-L-fucosidase [unclassified Caulobacter]KQV57346.1 alpha-L-fucosidase [Caulobacter sp. Root342]KQV66918.1 alpha-L-fucosidase [Caulobacter sp. Root343]